MSLGASQKRVAVRSGVFLGALALGLFATFVFEDVSSRTIARRVSCGPVALGGLSVSEAEQRLLSVKTGFESKPLTLQLAERHSTRPRKEWGVELDTADCAQRAFSVSRASSWGARLAFWLGRLAKDQVLPLASRVQEPTLHEQVAEFAAPSLAAPVVPSLLFKKKSLVVEPGVPGQVVDEAALTQALGGAFENFPSQVTLQIAEMSPVVPLELLQARQRQVETLVESSVSLLGPSQIEVAKLSPATIRRAFSSSFVAPHDIELQLSDDVLRKALRESLATIEKPAKDADFSFKGGKTQVLPSEHGVIVDMEQLKQDLLGLGKERHIQLRLIEVKPKLTTEQAEGLHIKGLVTQFTTYHACCQPRVDNIHKAAALLNGSVLSPGESFSLNGLLGPRSRATGYNMAPTIVRGEMQEVAGGGISQLATTLFNAVLRGGYAIIQRQPHSIYFSRYPEGHEATVSFPEPDLIFKNDTKTGMLIKTEYTGTFIRVLVYGDNEGRIVSVHKSARYDVKKPETEYEADPEMDPEKTRRLRAGQMGWTVLVSRKIRTLDGEVREEKREVVYQSRPELVRVHPCKIPEGAPGHTGEECPEPERDEREEELSDDVYYSTGSAAVEYDEGD